MHDDRQSYVGIAVSGCRFWPHPETLCPMIGNRHAGVCGVSSTEWYFVATALLSISLRDHMTSEAVQEPVRELASPYFYFLYDVNSFWQYFEQLKSWK